MLQPRDFKDVAVVYDAANLSVGQAAANTRVLHRGVRHPERMHAGAGVAKVPCSGFMSSRNGEAEAGHVGVDGLILTVSDLVGFVPDADGAV